jgi:hypothetical protein
MRNYKITLWLLATAISGLSMPGYAQVEKSFSYYVNLNTMEPNVPHPIMDMTLNFMYTDAFGKTKETLLRIFDWKHEQVASLRLDKGAGLNSYALKLEDIYSGWKFNDLYTAELKDDEGRLYSLPFKLLEPPDNIGPNVDISVNPVQVSCNGIGSSVVEFYGNITSGRAPFYTQWFVLNDHRTDFLYQPKEEIIQSVGKTSQIKVDKSPEYFVVFYVKDACGNEQKRMVKLVCDQTKKKINTIFVEQLPQTLFKPTTAGN